MALVLSTTFVRQPMAAGAALLTGVSGLLFGADQPAFLLRYFLLGAAADEALVDEIRRAIAARPRAAVARRAQLAGEIDVSREFRALDCPLLCLWAKYDHLLRSGVREDLARLRPDVTVRNIDAPHCLLQVSPQSRMVGDADLPRRMPWIKTRREWPA